MLGIIVSIFKMRKLRVSKVDLLSEDRLAGRYGHLNPGYSDITGLANSESSYHNITCAHKI